MRKTNLISLAVLAAMAASPALPAVREIEARALPRRPARPLPVKKSRSDIEAWNAAVDQRKAAKQARKRGGRNA
jgi:hypothetical protein